MKGWTPSNEIESSSRLHGPGRMAVVSVGMAYSIIIIKLLTNRKRSHIEESNIYIEIMVSVGQGREKICPKMALTPSSAGNEIALFATG